jgi:hypothetical protein
VTGEEQTVDTAQISPQERAVFLEELRSLAKEVSARAKLTDAELEALIIEAKKATRIS